MYRGYILVIYRKSTPGSQSKAVYFLCFLLPNVSGQCPFSDLRNN